MRVVMNRVHLIDCMEFMANVHDNYYELAIVDPPYGIGNFTQSDRKYSYKKYGDYTWNESIPPEKYFSELKRISKKRIIWGANYYNCFENGMAAIIWDKMNPHPSMSRCEIASVSWNKKVDYFQLMHYGAHQDRDNFHPSGKPVALYKWLLQNYAKPGWTIFDSHVGSGSLRIACHDLGFDFEGCEIDGDYWEAQEERYKNHIAQGELFETDEIRGLVYEKELEC
jgi:site-specific DNA-methyltransferase (adenine-specific)